MNTFRQVRPTIAQWILLVALIAGLVGILLCSFGAERAGYAVAGIGVTFSVVARLIVAWAQQRIDRLWMAE